MDENSSLIGGVEAGGTKFVCAVARQPDRPLVEERFEIAELTPGEALARTAEFFRENGPVESLGIGTFGPADLDTESPTFGSILTTPKPGWEGADFVGMLRKDLGEDLPVAFETDVNAAAIGEAEFGAAQGKENVCYVTVGTGIGGGFLHRGIPLHGRMHPEVGHTVVPDLDGDYDLPAPGSNCPFHASCLEGRASGNAITKQWCREAKEIPPDHPAWEMEARYLAHGVVNLTAAWSPDVILLGGGVMEQPQLIGKIRSEFEKLAGDYWKNLPPLEEYFVVPGLGNQAGIVGALELARRMRD